MASIVLDMSDLVSRDTGLIDPDKLVELLEGIEVRFDHINPEQTFDLEFTGSEENIYRLINRVADSDGDADVMCASIKF